MHQSSPLVGLGLVAALAATAPATHAPILQTRDTNATTPLTPATIFANVVPSAQLHWVDCYKPHYQCSVLTVPLDYTNASAGTTDLALARYLISEDAEDLLFNPGGPGEAGVGHIFGSGEQFAKRWGYNAVSFDPRGVGLTGPKLSCSPNNDTTLHRRDTHALGNLTESWSQSLERNAACAAANQHTAAKYVGTSAVVQDMVHFTELQATARSKDAKKALINYYGVSYGTAVGQTLVAMYPDRLRRVLLDGNVYGVAHYQGWEPSGIDDLAHGIWLFSKLCYEAGAEWCTLAEGANSTNEVKARFDLAVATLKAHPITVNGKPYDDNAFLGKVQQSMYAPRPEQFTKLSNMTVAALAGDSAHLSMVKREEPTEEPTDNPTDTSNVALSVITAVDIAGRYPWHTYEQWKAAADKLQQTAPYGAQNYATTNGIIGLAANIIPPPSQFFPGFKAITPSANVLFVNTVGDPVTPMSSARQMSKLFAGSGVLIVDGPGHGYTSAPSHCAKDVIATYMKSGTVPKVEKWCTPDVTADYYFGGPAADWTML